MKTSVKEQKNCQKIISVEIGSEKIHKEYEQFYKAIAPQAKIPGFRPGKVPQHILVMHYSKQAKDEVLKQLITDSYGAALRENTLEPLGYPDIKDVKFDDKKLSYQAVIETRPKIKLGRVGGLKARKPEVAVKPEEVTESLDRLRESMAQFKAVEDRPVAWQDYVIAD